MTLHLDPEKSDSEKRGSEKHGINMRLKNMSDFKELYFLKIMRSLICCSNGYLNFSVYEIFL